MVLKIEKSSIVFLKLLSCIVFVGIQKSNFCFIVLNRTIETENLSAKCHFWETAHFFNSIRRNQMAVAVVLNKITASVSVRNLSRGNLSKTKNICFETDSFYSQFIPNSFVYDSTIFFTTLHHSIPSLFAQGGK